MQTGCRSRSGRAYGPGGRTTASRLDTALARHRRPSERPGLRIVAAAALLALLCTLPDGTSAEAAPPRPDARQVNCDAVAWRDRVPDLTPSPEGPLALSVIYCQDSLSGWGPGTHHVAVSPDAGSILHIDHHRVRVALLDVADAATDYPIRLGAFERFGHDWSQPAFRWSSDSRAVWGATQDSEPDGFRHALGPMRPIRAEGGEIHALPEPSHAAGTLDAIFWAGDGLAVVQFGSRGSAYKQAHDDPDPTFAIVDARRGLVLDTLAFSAIKGLLQHQGSPGYSAYRVTGVEAAVLPDGRVRVFLNAVDTWVLWTQGQIARIMPDPYREPTTVALSPDGARLLVARALHVDETCNITLENCRYGPPVEGPFATLHDAATGQPLWTRRATAHRNTGYPAAPAISPDGRHALIALARTGEPPPDIGLISLQTGALVQTLPAPGEGYAMGFARDGRVVWTHARGVTALYDRN